MEPLVTKTANTSYGEKSISVFAQDITLIQEKIDVLAVSAFYRNYEPVPNTVIGALSSIGISVDDLSQSPEIDLREQCNIWLSRPVNSPRLPVSRIGCIEMSSVSLDDRNDANELEKRIISSIQAYFHMLHIASLSGIKIETIALPILGAGNQNKDPGMVTIPIINECFRFLKSNATVKRIYIITRNHPQAFQFALSLEKSYSALQESRALEKRNNSASEETRVFISYSSGDKSIADSLCSKLESNGIRVWYAPRNIRFQDYASAIVDAITQCTYFVVIVSKNSLQSNHVLNEIGLAFKELDRQIHIIPLKIDEQEMGPSFLYYLSRQQWAYASDPPIDRRLEEFVSSLCRESMA